MAATAVTTRRRIIPRPRLTRLLDENPARIKLLVAPAGYGKTTLAQQWLADPSRRDVWYRGGPASADVAALAAGIAMAASEIVPEAGKRMRQRISAVGHPEEDVDVLAELFAEDVQAWPSDAWLAVDDYHFAAASNSSERLVHLLTTLTPLQMIVTTRTRPSWASARRIVYGEIQEIDRRALAMEDDEAREVVGTSHETAELVERARGWPAVLGIAALTNSYRIPADDLPDQLYDYFAEELYRTTTPAVRDALHRLSLVPSMSAAFARELFAESASGVVQQCAELGALTVTDQGLSLHPLLRTFLSRKLAREHPNVLPKAAAQSVELLMSLKDWDTAFQVISEYAAPTLIVSLVDAAISDLLAAGRTQTLMHWLDFAARNHLSDPSLDLAEAEVAFRQGRFAKAEALASQGASGASSGLAAKMLIRAGQSAVMDSRDDQGLEYFRAARDLAETEHDQLEAAVGVCFAASEQGLIGDVDDALASLAAMEIQGIDVAARKAIVQLVHSSRVGGVQAALTDGAAVLPLLEDVKDPLVLTSFLNCYGHLLGVGAYYVDALRVANRHVAKAEEYRLTFALPHGCLVRAVAYCGLRDFARAAREIERATELAAPNDIHISMQAAALRARIALCRRDFDSALSHASRSWDRPGSRPMMAEYMAYRALGLACRGHREQAAALTDTARRTHRSSIETVTLAVCADAIAAIETDSDDAAELSGQAFDLVQATGGLDSLVTAGRACPDLLRAITRHENIGEVISPLLARSNDFRLGRDIGLDIVGPKLGPMSELTKREAEVAKLVSLGHTNQAIAERLFISESTVKVHISHILRKLDARRRTEIATRMVASEDYATLERSSSGSLS